MKYGQKHSLSQIDEAPENSISILDEILETQLLENCGLSLDEIPGNQLEGSHHLSENASASGSLPSE